MCSVCWPCWDLVRYCYCSQFINCDIKLVNMNDKSVSEKGIFIVGLLAAFLAFSSFKNELSVIYLSINGQDFSLLKLMMFFIVLLTLSVYLYALDYLKYSVGEYQNLFIFKILIPIGDFVYSLAMIFPVIVALGALLSSGPMENFLSKYNIIALIQNLALLSAVLFSWFYSYTISKKKREEIILYLGDNVSASLYRGLELMDDNYFAEAVLSFQKSLESYLREKLLEKKNLSSDKIPLRELIRLAANNKIINEDILDEVYQLVKIRNIAVHSSEPITREHAEFAFRILDQILDKEHKVVRFD